MQITIYPTTPNFIYNDSDKCKFNVFAANNDICVGADYQFKLSLSNETDENCISEAFSYEPDSWLVPFEKEFKGPGFYDINVSASLNGKIEGESRITVGHHPEKINLPDYRQPDFDDFWKNAIAEARQIPLNISMTLDTPYCTDIRNVYKVSFDGMYGVRYYTWLVEPKKPGKYKAVMNLPGYGNGTFRTADISSGEDSVEMYIQVLGYEMNLPQREYKLEDGKYMAKGILDPMKYSYRGIIPSCIRALDFLVSRPNVDTNRVFTNGSSQGGGLSIMVGQLHESVRVIAAGVPYLTYYPVSHKIAVYPYQELRDYFEEHPENYDQAMKTLSYFDAFSFADKIKKPIFIDMGIQDKVCPPTSIYGMYNKIKAPKKLVVIPTAGHDAAWYALDERYKFVNEHLG